MTSAGIDCSGLVHMAFRACGRLVPRDADQQEEAGEQLSEADLRPGDLVTYGPPEGADHIAFWVGGGRILHATAAGRRRRRRRGGRAGGAARAPARARATRPPRYLQPGARFRRSRGADRRVFQGEWARSLRRSRSSPSSSSQAAAAPATLRSTATRHRRPPREPRRPPRRTTTAAAANRRTSFRTSGSRWTRRPTTSTPASRTRPRAGA